MLIRSLYRAFDPNYLTPKVLAGAVQHLVPANSPAADQSAQQPRQERRKGERRQRQQKVLLDTRSPYSRRCATGRRHADQQDSQTIHTGLDIYA